MRFLLVSGLAITATACGGIVDQRSAIEQLPDVVDAINRDGNAEIAKQLPGAVVTARIDDGDTLVIMMGNVPLGNTTFDPNAVRKTLRPQVCGSENYRELFEEGGKVRVEMTSNFGKEMPAIQYSRCD